MLKTLIESCTKEGDIILDYHLGSGTTAAVAHKMHRRYIGVEQMDYIENITVERLKKVIAGDNIGISKEIGWDGGGSFVYLELIQTNPLIKKSIEAANNNEEFTRIYDLIMNDAKVINYKLDKEILIKSKEEFKLLDNTIKRKVLNSLLDKNFIYLPFSEIDDKDYGIDPPIKKFNKSFNKI